MEPRYIACRVARNSAISTRYLAAFAAICLVSTIVLSIGALMLSTFSDDQIARAICICLDVCFLHVSLAITGVVIVDLLQLLVVRALGAYYAGAISLWSGLPHQEHQAAKANRGARS